MSQAHGLILLTGPTGSGKSTFVKLVQRLYDLESGAIVIDGQDVSKVSQGSLRRAIAVEYDDGGQIGRRYRRQDEIGTPWALTVDEQTLEDDTVTIRDRDTMLQERVAISDLDRIVSEKVDLRKLLKQL